MIQGQNVKLSLRKNDQVQVIAGKEKGKSGKILKIHSGDHRVVVEGLNLVTRHTKATRTTNGGIVQQEASIDYSNVQLFCQKCNRGVRHGLKVVDAKSGKEVVSGADTKAIVKVKKIRICKRCNESLESA